MDFFKTPCQNLLTICKKPIQTLYYLGTQNKYLIVDLESLDKPVQLSMITCVVFLKSSVTCNSVLQSGLIIDM